MKRSNAPIFWLLFGAGGMLSALLGVGLVFITGIAMPSVMNYQSLLALTQNGLGKVFVLAVIALFAWHAAHRLLCSVHDLGIHKTLPVKLVFYGVAMVITLLAAGGLVSVGS